MTEDSLINEIELKRQRVEAFVGENSNRIEITDENRNNSTCGDGRTSREVGLQRALRQFGGDMGDYTVAVSTLRAWTKEKNIQLPPGFQKRVMDTVIKVVGGADNFYLHTDSHDPKTELTDNLKQRDILPRDSTYTPERCGDFGAKLEDPGAYGLTNEDLQVAVEYTSTGALSKIKNDKLEGNHGESAVIIVDGPMSLQTQDADGSQMFVLTKQLIEERNRAMVSALREEFPELSLDDAFSDRYGASKDNHHLVTGGKLAPGLPIFRVTISSLDAPAEVTHVRSL